MDKIVFSCFFLAVVPIVELQGQNQQTVDEQVIDETVRAEEPLTMDEYLKRLDRLLIGKIFRATRVPRTSPAHVDIQHWNSAHEKTDNGYKVNAEVFRVFLESGEVKYFGGPNEMYEEGGKLFIQEGASKGTIVGLKNGGYRTKWYKDNKLYLMRDIFPVRDVEKGLKTEQALYFPKYLKNPAVYHEVAK